MNLIDLLIFDFDGTLADSLPPAIEAIQATIAELGLPYKTKEEISKHIGYGETALVAGSIGTNEPRALKSAKEVYYRHYSERLKSISLCPHVKEVLEFFKKKIKIIISNKREEFIKTILDNHHITHHFTEILGGDNVPSLKPDPSAINSILQKYKISPNRALLIGDMTVDIETGKNAGVITCAVTYGFHARSELIKFKPNFLIDDLLELKELIK